MRAKVLQKFRDRYSGKIYEAGTTLTISKDRYQEIRKKGRLVEEVKGKPKATTD